MKKRHKKFWEDVEELAIQAVTKAREEYMKVCDAHPNVHDVCMHDGDTRIAYQTLERAMQIVDVHESEYQERERWRELNEEYEKGKVDGLMEAFMHLKPTPVTREPDGVEFD
jgi:hypothetical protein